MYSLVKSENITEKAKVPSGYVRIPPLPRNNLAACHVASFRTFIWISVCPEEILSIVL